MGEGRVARSLTHPASEFEFHPEDNEESLMVCEQGGGVHHQSRDLRRLLDFILCNRLLIRVIGAWIRVVTGGAQTD